MMSSLQHLDCGVLHGSVVGHLLFLWSYINALESVRAFELFLYADDAVLLDSHKTSLKDT